MTNTLSTFAAPAGRALLALIFLLSGVQKLGAYAATQAYMDIMGVPGALLPLVIAVELVAGLALLVGWQARAAAFLLAGFSLLAGLLFHLVPSFGLEPLQAQGEMISFLKNVAIAGGLLTVVALGAGPVSFDHRGRSGATAAA